MKVRQKKYCLYWINVFLSNNSSAKIQPTNMMNISSVESIINATMSVCGPFFKFTC